VTLGRVTGSLFPLPDSHLPKGLRYMRALRRAIHAYAIAAMEDREAAALEARAAASAVNILDEAVFQHAFAGPYRRHRAGSDGGRLVMGLELVRNCEEHSPVVFDDLLVETGRFGVPLPGEPAASRARAVYAWAPYDALPRDYAELGDQATTNQKRARKEAQDGYRKQVAGRPVTDVLLDAAAYFHTLDARLAAPPAPADRHALPPVRPGAGHTLYRLIGADRYETTVPAPAARPHERPGAGWPAADRALDDPKTGLRRRAQRRPPRAPARQVQYLLLDDAGKLVGYSGRTAATGTTRAAWVDGTAQVRRDLDASYPYYVTAADGTDAKLVRTRSGTGLAAPDTNGQDLLAALPEARDLPGRDLTTLTFLQKHPDLYIAMRHAT
jgi:hypothetical protein